MASGGTNREVVKIKSGHKKRQTTETTWGKYRAKMGSEGRSEHSRRHLKLSQET